MFRPGRIGRILVVLTVWIHYFMPGIAHAQLSYGELFQSDHAIECTLAFNFKSGMDKSESAAYEGGMLTLFEDTQHTLDCPVELRARGKSRRQYCQFPPLSVKINLDEAVARGKMDEDKFKLVTHCQPDASYERFVLEEFLVYKMYEVLTAWSFHTRLLHINYLDTGKRGREVERYAFLIENLNLLTRRTGGQYASANHVNPVSLDPYYECLLAVFQYMIGNTDWSIRNLHNIVVIHRDDNLDGRPVPLPYDFDMCGFIDAPHAMPSPILNLNEVTDRLYRGYCVEESILDSVINTFLNKEHEIMGLIADFDFLKENQRKRNIRFIESFYRLLEDPLDFHDIVKAECRVTNP